MALVVVAGAEDPVGRALVKELDKREGMDVAAISSLGGEIPPEVAVVVAGPAVGVESWMEFAARMGEASSDVAVLAIVPEAGADLLRAALRAGVRDVLCTTDGPDAILSSIVSAHDSVLRRREHEAPAAVAPEPEPPAQGKIVTVFSTKGGVGKSVIATNLGVALASDLGKRTILVDLDLQFGDVSVMLQLPPDRTIFDAVQVFDRLDAEMLKGFLVTHSSGLIALLAPVQPEEAESVTTARITKILGLLRQMADFVVVDTPASLSEVVLTALDKSDYVLAVATMDVPSVKNTKISLEKLHQLGYDGTTVRLVLNRADSKVWLEPHEIEKAIAERIVARIPSDRLVPRAVNKGVPVVMDAPRSAVARSMVTLAREVAAG